MGNARRHKLRPLQCQRSRHQKRAGPSVPYLKQSALCILSKSHDIVKVQGIGSFLPHIPYFKDLHLFPGNRLQIEGPACVTVILRFYTTSLTCYRSCLNELQLWHGKPIFKSIAGRDEIWRANENTFSFSRRTWNYLAKSEILAKVRTKKRAFEQTSSQRRRKCHLELIRLFFPLLFPLLALSGTSHAPL